MNKIIIFGFPHCGTTILRSIIGHIDEVDVEIAEQCDCKKQTNKKYALCKTPFLINLNHPKYNEYIKIFIIRNPFYVFSSLNKRFDYFIPLNHQIDKYIDTIRKFNYYKNNPVKNLYTIRYEDMFDNNYQALKTMFTDIGFNYDDKIFNNTHYTNISHTQFKTPPENKPLENKHEEYRMWQINQQFINNNDHTKLRLVPYQINMILDEPEILDIYPNIIDTLTSSNT